MHEYTELTDRAADDGAVRDRAAPAPAWTAPAPPRIQSHWPIHGEDEIEAVCDVLRSGRVNSLQHGDHCRAFEDEYSLLCGMPFAISLANGTLALELALRALDIGPGDQVIVTPRSFIASASCVRTCGATPVFADVDPVSQNITAETISACLTPTTRAVIVVHLAGWPCAMDEIAELAHRHGIRIIEDCAQAHGATWKGHPVGSFGDAAAFSFCTDKIMSTGGEGGMLLLRDRTAWSRAWRYKDHGKDPVALAQNDGAGLFRWLHVSVGSNYRMTEMQAAIGRRQLRKLHGWVVERRRNAALLNETLDGLDALRLTPPPDNVGHAYYKYYAFLRPERLKLGWTRDRIVREVNALGVPCFSGICPEIYLERAFADASPAPAKRLTVARRLGETSLMLPVDPTLGEEEIRTMGLTLRTVMLGATGA